jgi:hypothetical protein
MFETAAQQNESSFNNPYRFCLRNKRQVPENISEQLKDFSRASTAFTQSFLSDNFLLAAAKL